MEFEIQKIHLFTPGADQELVQASDSKKVPVLMDQELPGQPIWDSMAILEHIVEAHPEHLMWPKDPAARAFARCAAAEMHAGFFALRAQMPMNCKRENIDVSPDAACMKDIQRVYQIWHDARSQFSDHGEFLAGPFSLVDAFYAPVVWRLRTYVQDLPEIAQRYCQTMLDLPAMQTWKKQALEEQVTIEAIDALGFARTAVIG